MHAGAAAAATRLARRALVTMWLVMVTHPPGFKWRVHNVAATHTLFTGAPPVAVCGVAHGDNENKRVTLFFGAACHACVLYSAHGRAMLCGRAQTWFINPYRVNDRAMWAVLVARRLLTRRNIASNIGRSSCADVVIAKTLHANSVSMFALRRHFARSVAPVAGALAHQHVAAPRTHRGAFRRGLFIALFTCLLWRCPSTLRFSSCASRIARGAASHCCAPLATTLYIAVLLLLLALAPLHIACLRLRVLAARLHP